MKTQHKNQIWSDAHCNDFGQSKPETAQGNKAQHSPLPWQDDTWQIEAISDGRKYFIADVYGRTESERTANAKLIVASVNHADKLAEALRDLIEQLHIYVNSDDADLPDPSDAERQLTAYEAAR